MSAIGQERQLVNIKYLTEEAAAPADKQANADSRRAQWMETVVGEWERKCKRGFQAERLWRASFNGVNKAKHFGIVQTHVAHDSFCLVQTIISHILQVEMGGAIVLIDKHIHRGTVCYNITQGFVICTKDSCDVFILAVQLLFNSIQQTQVLNTGAWL